MAEEKGYVRKTKAETFVVTYHCPKCQETMTYTGVMLPSNPPWYEHVCTCGHSERLRRTYPWTEVKVCTD